MSRTNRACFPTPRRSLRPRPNCRSVRDTRIEIGHYALVATSADRLIAVAASDRLASVGLIRKGRSRTWIDDHGWWLINVEFQPSSHAHGCYLNIGVQHLWVVRNHLTFEGFERPLGASAFVTFDGDEDAFLQSMAQVIGAADAAIGRRRESHGDGIEALKRLVNGDDDLNAGIAAALLGDDATALARLAGRILEADRAVADSYLGKSAPDARARAASAIAETRALLHLASVDADWW